MKRRLFNFAAAVSLLLAICTSALWMRSCAHCDVIGGSYSRWPRHDECRAILFEMQGYSQTVSLAIDAEETGPAAFAARLDQVRYYGVNRPAGLRTYWLGDNDTRIMSFPAPGFSADSSVYMSAGYRDVSCNVAIRPWLPLVLFLVLPALWLIRRRKASRAKRRGLCPVCGYDLRATPDRCPECGTARAPSQNLNTLLT
jgi:hypothetical protein